MRWLSGLLVGGSIVAVIATLFFGSPVSEPSAETSAADASCVLPVVDVPVRCRTVDVLEAADDPRGRRIPIRVIVVPSDSASPLPDPVVFLVGGPGQGAADLAAPLAERLSFLRDRRDLVLIDQRGTGESNGLHCPPPARARDLMGHIFDAARLRACRDELSKRADLRRYTTAAAAADYAAVFDALGYDKVNVWGVSYGTRMGLELARRLPHRVRTLVMEGVVPPFFAWPTHGARDADAALTAVIADCEADRACAASYPAFRRDVEAAFAALATRSITATVFDPHTRAPEHVPFGASDLAYATRGLLYGADALKLPRLFRAAAAGQYDRFAQAYVTRARTLGRELATGVHLGVYCSEDVPYADLARARQEAAGTRIAAYLIEQYTRACEIWPRAPIAEGFRDPVRSAVPALIMTGQRDPVTPPWTAYEAAKTLSGARVITWRYGGHGYDGLVDQSCRRGIIREFVAIADAGRVPVDCTSRDRTLPFEES